MTKKINLKLEDVLLDVKRVYIEKGVCTQSIYTEFGIFDPQLFKRKLGLSFSEIQKILEIPSRKYNHSKEDLIEDVLSVYQELGFITKDKYIEVGKYSRKPIDRYFGSWNNMLKELNLPINCLINIPEIDLLEDLKRVFNEVGMISVEIVKEVGRYSIEVYCRRFGSFNNAILKAGLIPNEQKNSILALYIIRNLSIILEEEPELEKKFDWLVYKRPMRLDAYFPKYNLAIEYDGMQHYEEVLLFDNEFCHDPLEIRQERDQMKNKLLEEHGIKLLRIRYDEPVGKEYLKGKLSMIL